MKKILAFAAVAMLALGAQALEYSYNWTINIDKIDPEYTLPSDLTAYLRDGKTGATLAIVSVGMFDEKYDLVVAKANETAKTLGLNTDYQKGMITKSADPNHDGMILYNANMTYKSTQNLIADYKNTGDPLIIVLEGTDAAGIKKSQTLDVSWNEKTSTDFGGSATYNPTPVPEPTSGVLLVMGLAGLALKRKRAA